MSTTCSRCLPSITSSTALPGRTVPSANSPQLKLTLARLNRSTSPSAESARAASWLISRACTGRSTNYVCHQARPVIDHDHAGFGHAGAGAAGSAWAGGRGPVRWSGLSWRVAGGVVIEVGGRIVKRGRRCSDGLRMQASVGHERGLARHGLR